MRISDWSSDVCSSDLDHVHSGLTTNGSESVIGFEIAGADKRFYPAAARIEGETIVVSSPSVTQPKAVRYAWADDPGRSEERRVGKEGVSTCRSRWWPYH